MNVIDSPPNPFATRFIRPDRLAYQRLAGNEPETVWSRFRSHRYRGQIVGPHGSGKTSLLHQLAALCDTASMPWRIVCRLANHGPLESSQNTDEVLFLEGIELLSPWRQWRLLRSLRHQRLLITSHRALHGLPVIAQLTPDLDLAQTLVATLLSGRHGSELATDTVRECFEEHQGNLREMMLALYDVYEELPVCSAAESSGG